MKAVLQAGWLALLLIGASGALGQTYVRGQLSGWAQIEEEEFSENSFGVRYIPELSFGTAPGEGISIDGEISLKASAGGRLHSPGSRLDTYRFWARLSSAQYELRAGLQKINFGAATLLRPLMWFDWIDPRDPLGLTNGVYGLLGRCFFLNNANLWVWGLYGNDKSKGWELLPSDDGAVEFGGRFQYPLGSGDLALTYHRRMADPDLLFSGTILNDLPSVTDPFDEFLNDPSGTDPLDDFSSGTDPFEPLAEIDPNELLAMREAIPEQRFALDGRWDLEIGLWGEGVVVHQDSRLLPFQYRHFLTIGADYTFAVGNGLHVLGEHLFFAQSKKLFGADEDRHFSALSLNYNAGMLDRLTAIAYYNWEEKQSIRFVGWGRVYDDWNIFLNGFWNAESGAVIQGGPGGGAFGAKKGIQLLVVFNHLSDIGRDE